MAGDWIKVEKATASKPEVLRISRALGVSKLHALGACVAFWQWADDATADGYLTGMTQDMLDEAVGIPGLAGAMVEVGWLAEVRNGLQICNHDRHNGKNAKNRALATRRQADWRDGHGITPPPRAAWRRNA